MRATSLITMQQNSRLDDDVQPDLLQVLQPDHQSTTSNSGSTDVLLDDDDEPPTENEDLDEYVPERPNQDDPAPDPIPEVRRNPPRNRRIPDRYGPYLQH